MNTTSVPPSPSLTLRTLSELQAMCRDAGLQWSGTKAVLVQRLLDPESAPKAKRPRTAGDGAVSTRASKSTRLRVVKYVPRRTVIVKRNAHGNYEDPETRFVFELIDNRAVIVGVQLDTVQTVKDPKTGATRQVTTRELTPEEQELCVLDGFEFAR